MGVAGERGAFAVLRCVLGRGLGKKTSGVGRSSFPSSDGDWGRLPSDIWNRLDLKDEQQAP
jgi:hypothetical protein